MIQISSVVIVSSEWSLKNVAYESSDSSGPGSQHQATTLSIWSTYLPRKNDFYYINNAYADIKYK